MEFSSRGKNRVEALATIDLEIPTGKFVSIVGPTGCGKSTLLSIIGGFQKPTEGVVESNGKIVNGPSPDTTMLFQTANLFPWLSVLDNVMFGAKFGGGRLKRQRVENDVRIAAEDFLSDVGLSFASNLYPYQISGGMRARAALGRVLITKPPIVLFDEPFGSLDALTRSSMHGLLIQLFERNKQTAVLVTHDIEEAAILSDTIYVMSARPGKITHKFDSPFARPRNYDEILGSMELTKERSEILAVLRPAMSEASGLLRKQPT